jgi:hypothetical protein
MDMVTTFLNLLSSECLYSVTVFVIAFKKERGKMAGTLEHHIFIFIYFCILL